MARKTKEELNSIQNKFNVDRLWSWSRYNCYKNSTYEYFLKYVKREKPTRESIYAVMGGLTHDILEKFYKGKITYEDMIDEYNNALLKVNLMNLKYNRSDEQQNEKIAKKYEACLEHFFKHHIPIREKLVSEGFLLIEVGKYMFQGYFDLIYKDKDGNFVIVDWKTSTIYTGKKIDKEKGQLVLYAEALRQKGIPLNKIKIKWNFMKYLSITYPQKNGKTRTTHAERHSWVRKIKNNAKMWLKDLKKYTDKEIRDMLNYSLEFNTIENLPKEIQDKYIFSDCYVEVPFTEKDIKELKQDIIKTLDEIVVKEKEYQKIKDDMIFDEKIKDDQSYYFANLCCYNAKQHKPYGRYLDKQEQFINDMYKTDKNEEDDDMSWMREIGLI